ncbi:hypothetical protein [Flavobacterium stagni]|uniref:Uncharacterized protein n=1 Tax=Flavobacterium stagni TaxID=2506421 RepID=A0A4Q1K7K4_9FLAO|nr:hypothetical protein [Flavobacterium stagni]RXR21621.1 hypothetical protein EQG61_11460 [Flavobacterium stagni]
MKVIKIIFRFIKILFKRNKMLKESELHYFNKYLFEQSFVIIHYSFKNALYYSFNGKIELNSGIKIFNISNVTNPIQFRVYGFFQSKEYTLQLEVTNRLNSEKFKTELDNFKIQLNGSKILKTTNTLNGIELKPIYFTHPKVSTESKYFEIFHSEYNQTDFL